MGGCGLTKSHRLVEYFISEFYRNKMEDLSHIVSPDFVYRSVIVSDLTYAEFCERMRLYIQNANVSVDDIHSEDDVVFIVNYTLEIISNTVEYGKKIADKMRITVADDKIIMVEVGYEATSDSIEAFKKIL